MLLKVQSKIWTARIERSGKWMLSTYAIGFRIFYGEQHRSFFFVLRHASSTKNRWEIYAWCSKPVCFIEKPVWKIVHTLYAMLVSTLHASRSASKLLMRQVDHATSPCKLTINFAISYLSKLKISWRKKKVAFQDI